MAAGSQDMATAGAAGWARSHPGRSALVAVLATYVGLAAFLAGMAEMTVAHGHASPLWTGAAITFGAALFVAGLPASLGFAATCCATQRELVAGVVSGFAAACLTLGLVVFCGPPCC